MTFNMDISMVIGIASATAAIISLIFAWMAVKAAEKSNASGLFTELHKIYNDDRTFSAIKTVWATYNKYQENADGTLITRQQAYQIVSEQDRESSEWKAIHDMSLFWKYTSLLMQKGYLDEELVFEAFTSPRMLGFLAPIEKTFLEYHYYDGKETEMRTPLLWLYERWKRYSRERKY